MLFLQLLFRSICNFTVMCFQPTVEKRVETSVEQYGKHFCTKGNYSQFPHILPMLKSQFGSIKQHEKTHTTSTLH